MTDHIKDQFTRLHFGKWHLSFAFFALQLALAQSAWCEQSWYARGLNDYSTGHYAGAVSSLSMAVQQDPGNDMAHYYLANALLRIGHQQRALQEYSRAYECAQSEELASNCMTVLKYYRQQVPLRSSPRRMRMRAAMRAYTSQSVEAINNLAGQQSTNRERATDSSRDGVQVFKAAPESGGGMKLLWDRWIEEYRIGFNTVLAQQMRGVPLSGRTKMVFSVDKDRHLRGRILETDAPVFVTDNLLATTRSLDGAKLLQFPGGSEIPGFNFTMSYTYSAPRADTSTLASMRRTNASLLNPAGQRAVAGALGNRDVSGTLGSGQVTGSLRSKNTSAAIGARGTAAGLSAQEAAGIPLPQIDTNVSGLVLPKAKLVELKATPKLLDLPPIKEAKPH
jgi:hypothetical protein